MTRTKRNDPRYSIETGGNPLSNPYATYPIEEASKEQKAAEAKRRAIKLMDEFVRGIDRTSKPKCEILEAMAESGPFIALINLYKVASRCDLTSTSEEYQKAVERLKISLDTQLEEQMLFNVEHGE